MPTIHVDGKPYEVDGERDLLTTLLHLGVNLPYFCWHPALGSVGACRQCAVKIFRDEKDCVGGIVMACMTPVTHGLRVSVKDPEVIEYRRHVTEWLMINHPHDCPVCDEGGECHLQDMTVMTGQVYRRTRSKKRTYRNQDLGPFVNHEMNRCIQCYRCVRFYRDYAGGRDFEAFASKNHVYFGRHQDGPLESEFSGNLVEVCPTGVFTDKTLKSHYARKWDLTTAPSVCVHCGVGCNTIPGERYGTLRRIRNRFNPEVNGFFLCDRGRFGYEFVSDGDRPRAPVGSTGEKLGWEDALERARRGLAGCRRVLGIGSPRASLEANFALKTVVGAGAFSTGMADVEHEALAQATTVLRKGPARSASLADVETADAILVLGADPTNEAPMLALAVRQAVHAWSVEEANGIGIPAWNDYAVRDAARRGRGALFVAGHAFTKLDELAAATWRGSPNELLDFAWEIAGAIDGPADGTALPGRIAHALAAASRPLVVVGTGGGKELLRAASNIAASTSGKDAPALVSVVAPECDSMGVALLGGVSVTEALAEIETGKADGLVVLENDLFRRAPPQRVMEALAALTHVVVIDGVMTPTARAANEMLPAATFAESTGTLVNAEGRAQRYYQVLSPNGGTPRPSWRIVESVLGAGRPDVCGWERYEDLARAMAAANPALAGALEAAPPASWRDRTGEKVARASHRFSGRTAKDADRTIYEPRPPADPDSPFAFSMEGLQAEPPAPLIPRYWYPGWNSEQAGISRYHIESGRAREDRTVGVRLLEPERRTSTPFKKPKKARALGKGEFWLVPQAAVFGSEELSRRSRAVASRIPPAIVRVNPADAKALAVASGDGARMEWQGRELVLPAVPDESVAAGVVIVPMGYPETAGITGPVVVNVGRA